MFEDNVDFIGFLPPEVDVEPLTKRPKMGAQESQNVADIVDAGQANNENDDRDALPKTPTVVAKSSRPTKSITIDMMMEAATPWLSSYLYAASTNAGKGKNATDLPGDSSVLEMHDFLALPPIRQLHEEILAFSSYISPTSQERLARLACVNRIEAALKKAWPSAKVRGPPLYLFVCLSKCNPCCCCRHCLVGFSFWKFLHGIILAFLGH